MLETIYGVCNRNVPCSECDERRCIFHGDNSASCPCEDCVKYGSDESCEGCERLHDYIKEMQDIGRIDWLKMESVLEDPVYMFRRWFTAKYGTNSQSVNELLGKMQP